LAALLVCGKRDQVGPGWDGARAAQIIDHLADPRLTELICIQHGRLLGVRPGRDQGRSGLPDLTANATALVETWARQAITDTGTTTWRQTETDTSYARGHGAGALPLRSAGVGVGPDHEGERSRQIGGMERRICPCGWRGRCAAGLIGCGL
jgi:hypothetical protein